MITEPTLDDLRRELMKRSECKFVDRSEYCRLLVGRGQFIRADDAAAKVRGLMDRDTGRRFLIEEERLFAEENVA